MTWQPIPRSACGECGRLTPDYYNARNDDIADAYESGISSRRLAKAYGVSEERTIQIITEQLGRRAYLTAWHEGDE